MTQAADISRAFEREFERLDRAHRLGVARVVRNVYRHIMVAWPVWSGYSKANNRISITGSSISRVEPAKRTWRPGAHTGKAASTERSELAKLKTLETMKGFGKKDRTIVIGNAVDYAADMKNSPLTGNAIYEEARQIGEGTRID